MATLTIDKARDKSGKTAGFTVQWYEEGKPRQSLYLSGKRYAKRTAERLKDVIEKLLYYRRNPDVIPDKGMMHWIQSAPEEIRRKLAKVGLITITEPRTCQSLWDEYLKFKATEIKESSLNLYRRRQVVFLETFSPAEHITGITEERLLEWKAILLTKYVEPTVAGILGMTKAVLNWAVKKKWLSENPMAEISIGSFRNEKNDRTFTMAEYTKLLEACECQENCQEWQTIIALARIGGLRCPSELQELKWEHIHWNEDWFLVHSPKNERYEKHRTRPVPLFDEIREELKRLFVDSEGNEFVIQSFQGTSWSLDFLFQQIARKAGLVSLGRLKRPFDNLRMSCSNQVLREHGATMESQWVGHSDKVMREHYLRLEASDFAKAVGKTVK